MNYFAQIPVLGQIYAKWSEIWIVPPYHNSENERMDLLEYETFLPRKKTDSGEEIDPLGVTSPGV